MTAFNLITVFSLGAVVGSFLNLCAYRIPLQEPIVFGRSVCPQCKHILGALDLIPILSFALLLGRCRHCSQNISFRYVGTECLSGLLFVVLFNTYGLTTLFLTYLSLTGILLVAAFIDIDYLYVPNSLIIFGLIAGSLLKLVSHSGTFSGTVVGFLAGGLPLLAVYLISHGGMGGGDVKLGAVLGVFLGWKLVFLGLFLSFLSGSIVGLLLILSGKKSRKDALPFAPFLAIGGFAAAAWGAELLSWYAVVSGL